MIPRLRIGSDVETGETIYLSDKERLESVLITGKTGAGKTNEMLNWWCTDCDFDVARILIEPDGFFARDAYSAAEGNAYYCSLEHPLSINPMRQPFGPTEIISSVAESMNMIISSGTNDANQSMTSKMRNILDRDMRECFTRNRFSLLSVRDAIKLGAGDRETRDGIVARLNFILSDERMNQILCGPGTLDIEKLIEEGGAFILDCSGMTTDQQIFVGNIVSQTVRSYFRFARPAEYLPLSLYVDECHLFTSPNWTDILRRGRKYQLSAILATQQISNFSPEMRRTLLHVGTILSFRVGHQEALYIAKEMHLPPEHLQFLDKYHLGYLTPSARGEAIGPRPPIIDAIEIITNEHSPMTITWFDLHPFDPEETTTSPAVFVDAPKRGAETLLSPTEDG